MHESVDELQLHCHDLIQLLLNREWLGCNVPVCGETIIFPHGVREGYSTSILLILNRTPKLNTESIEIHDSMCMLINFKRTSNGFKQWNPDILRWKKYSISQGCNVFDFDVSTYIKIKNIQWIKRV